MSSTTTQKTRRPRRAARQSCSYRDDSSDFDDQDEINAPPRRSKRQFRVHEAESHGYTFEESDSAPTEIHPHFPGSRVALRSQDVSPNSGKRKTPLRSLLPPNSRSASFKRRKFHHPAKASVTEAIIPPSSSTARCKWQTLEYEILVAIFKAAAYPLYGPASQASRSIQWLLGVSRLSRSFHAASVAVLFESPPLYPAFRAHGLIKLLGQEPQSLSTNFQSKIRILEVEVKHLLVKKSGISLTDIIKHTPRLTGLRLYHNHDQIGPHVWALPAAAKEKFEYPGDIFDVLDHNGISLHLFEWNGRFPSSSQVIDNLADFHRRPCLRRLKQLTLMNLNFPAKCTAMQRSVVEERLSAALEALPDLSDLRFEFCDLTVQPLLVKIPASLKTLEFFNCSSLTSPALEALLEISGSHLKKLILVSNQALDLGFMPHLAELVPRLRILMIDLTYTDPSSYHDIDPHFDELLPSGQPTWPASLVELDLSNLRNLTALEAEAFFESLVDAAPRLSDLRSLKLKAIVKVGWRERSQMRQKWKAKFEEVFLRSKFRPFTNHGPAARRGEKAPNEIFGAASTTKFISDSSPISSAAGGSHRKSERIGKQISQQIELLEEAANIVQGMCHTVTFRMDDQRPADSQFREADFLDEEQSGDEEWTQ